jgi:hypothetical protein
MKLFHASKHKFDIIERRQAQHPEADEFDVPGGELQNKIYLTPDLGFALAMAAGPDGMTSLSDDRISFERADEFDPEKQIYVYEIDSESVDPGLLEQIDDHQIVIDIDELTPVAVHEFKAQAVFKYYEHVEWKRPNESAAKMKFS